MFEKDQKNCFLKVTPEHMFFWKWSFASDKPNNIDPRYLGKTTSYVGKVNEEDKRFPMWGFFSFSDL